jgi:hypothetical protein
MKISPAHLIIALLAAFTCVSAVPATGLAADVIAPTADTAPAGTADVDPTKDMKSDPVAHTFAPPVVDEGAAKAAPGEHGPVPTSESAADYGASETLAANGTSYPTAVAGAYQAPQVSLPFTGLGDTIATAVLGAALLFAGSALHLAARTRTSA